MLGDEQFLTLVLLPLLSVGLVVLVALETLVSGYRLLGSDDSLTGELTSRWGCLLIRVAEAGIAFVGLTIMAAAIPPLLADSTPAPAGVGIMLLLFAVGLRILCASFVRSSADLFVYTRSSGPKSHRRFCDGLAPRENDRPGA